MSCPDRAINGGSCRFKTSTRTGAAAMSQQIARLATMGLRAKGLALDVSTVGLTTKGFLKD